MAVDCKNRVLLPIAGGHAEVPPTVIQGCNREAVAMDGR
jgi:hypothetical protein